MQDERVLALRLDQAGQVRLLDGWTSSGAKGSTLTRPDAIWARMSLSESSTQATYRFRYDVVAAVVRPMRYAWIVQLVGLGGSRGCSSMAEHQLPKLTVRVRFPSPAPTRNHRSRLASPERKSLRCPQSAWYAISVPLAARVGEA